MEEDDSNKKGEKNEKLKKHLFKYIGILHKYERYCLLGLLFPTDKNINQKNAKNYLMKKKEKN